MDDITRIGSVEIEMRWEVDIPDAVMRHGRTLLGNSVTAGTIAESVAKLGVDNLRAAVLVRIASGRKGADDLALMAGAGNLKLTVPSRGVTGTYSVSLTGLVDSYRTLGLSGPRPDSLRVDKTESLRPEPKRRFRLRGGADGPDEE